MCQFEQVMDLRNMVSQPGEEVAWATFRTVQERSNVPTKHNPEPLVRLTATSRYSDEETSFDDTKITIAGIDDIDGLVARAYSQKRVEERSIPADLTPAPTRMGADAREREAPENPHEDWPLECDCSADKQVVTQMRSDLEKEIPDARAEIQEMSGLTLATLKRSRFDMAGVDRRSLFEVYTELWRAWEQSATFQAEVKSKRRLSVCISADLDLSKLGDVDFRIKVDRFRGLEVASKFRVPIHACTKSLDPPRDWPPEASSIPSHSGVLEGLSVIINVSTPLRLTVLEGQAVTVRHHHKLIWIWIPAGDFAASTEVPKACPVAAFWHFFRLSVRNPKEGRFSYLMSEATTCLGWGYLIPTLLHLSKSLCAVLPGPFDKNGEASRAIGAILGGHGYRYPFCEYLKVHAHLLSGTTIDTQAMKDMIGASIVETSNTGDLDGNQWPPRTTIESPISQHHDALQLFNKTCEAIFMRDAESTLVLAFSHVTFAFVYQLASHPAREYL
ncbi:hypothetical protein QBC40DRAFT_292393 [Triangularia verruculosa]|uniref:Uncharacterized protein n=1 Tax=Triangularia verruculosa TaxID=2587418 RepID=A0AAN7AZ19_9PEZI|nr:hypothetical protein QBC40DRAFT_292393 [Triangularia verruculosa]